MTIKQYLKRASERRRKRSVKGQAIFGRKRRKQGSASTVRQLIINVCDGLYSRLIRARDHKRFGGYCPLCFDLKDFRQTPIQVPFHVITRAKYCVRWDTRNGIGTCSGCNLQYEHDQRFIESVHRWYKVYYGVKQWDELLAASRVVGNVPTSFIAEQRDSMRREIERPGGPR